ncbi:MULTISPECIES: tetratricopeptide repeat protein [unclassified Prochlorococcus]|uniref:tetratricopeptide repeat protein n=1 Tax=unclassified Prochlorococcus TaxID=2627481 RepID=UPI000533968E|nr:MULTISPECIES: tetratricopeptide repeat protein [unclassified Prochlorococcus]KGG14612.1 TPR repeat precursor [Prochlorococcus sp. MIT 0602]KGG15961.1 TPR repeat precursor [Prochlorococcus sp. MIT 0603]
MKKYWSFSIILSLVFLLTSPCEALVKDSSPLVFEKALSQTHKGDFINALKSWDSFLSSFPENASALSNRGNVRLILGDIKGAILDQTRAIELLPLEIDPHLNRGIAEEALEEWDAAIDDYLWVLEKEPDNPSALYNLGNVMGAAHGDWLQSKTLFHKASLADSSFTMALSGEALACYQLNQFDQAEKALRSLIRKYPMFVDGRAALTALLWKEGSIGEAESHWAAVAGLDSRYSDQDWLLYVRHWPPSPSKDLMAFLDLQNK